MYTLASTEIVTRVCGIVGIPEAPGLDTWNYFAWNMLIYLRLIFDYIGWGYHLWSGSHKCVSLFFFFCFSVFIFCQLYYIPCGYYFGVMQHARNPGGHLFLELSCIRAPLEDFAPSIVQSGYLLWFLNGCSLPVAVACPGWAGFGSSIFHRDKKCARLSLRWDRKWIYLSQYSWKFMQITVKKSFKFTKKITYGEEMIWWYTIL